MAGLVLTLIVMIGFLTPLADSGISYAFGFVFFATNLLAAAMIYFFLYESRMLSLESVDLMYSQPDLKPWSSASWTPPGYITREQRDDAYFLRQSERNKSTAKGESEDSAIEKHQETV